MLALVGTIFVGEAALLLCVLFFCAVLQEAQAELS